MQALGVEEGMRPRVASGGNDKLRLPQSVDQSSAQDSLDLSQPNHRSEILRSGAPESNSASGIVIHLESEGPRRARARPVANAGRADLTVGRLLAPNRQEASGSGRKPFVAGPGDRRPGSAWRRSLFALYKTAHYYVIAYTKIRPTCPIACNF